MFKCKHEKMSIIDSHEKQSFQFIQISKYIGSTGLKMKKYLEVKVIHNKHTATRKSVSIFNRPFT